MNKINLSTHGINNIKTEGNATIYEGAFHKNPFVIKFVRNSYQTLQYKEIDKSVRCDDDFTELIDFIRNPNIINSYRREVRV